MAGTAVVTGFARSDAGVMEEALRPGTPLEANLRTLTDNVGGRIPGTPEFGKAKNWAIAAFRQAGADTVTTEAFTIPQSWSEGKTTAEIISPTRFIVRAQSIAWTPFLPPTTARVVDIGTGSHSELANGNNISGAILLVHGDVLKTFQDLFEEYFRVPPILDFAVKGHALAVAFTSSRENDLLYRHINTLSGRIDKIPQVLFAREDSLRIQRIIAHGGSVRMALSIPNKIGPEITTENVIADLKGAETPDEVVILGAHLDSWELGTGALDDGCNAALVIDALRAIRTSIGHPKRTIRFVLFSGEEQGTFGSLAYVRAHRTELDKIATEVVLDAGTGAITGFSTGGRKDMDDALLALVEGFASYHATEITNDAGIGTDNFDFMLEGVPTIVPNQAPANYLVNYHASSDTFDKVDLRQLKINEAVAAELTVELANLSTRVAGRYSRAEIEKSFTETHLDDQMKLLGFWQSWTDGSRGRKP